MLRCGLCVSVVNFFQWLLRTIVSSLHHDSHVIDGSLQVPESSSMKAGEMRQIFVGVDSDEESLLCRSRARG